MAGAGYDGGAIRFEDGYLKLSRVTVVDSHALDKSGGLDITDQRIDTSHDDIPDDGLEQVFLGDDLAGDGLHDLRTGDGAGA